MKIKELLENQKTFVTLFNEYGWFDITDKNQSRYIKKYTLNQYTAIIELENPEKLTMKRWEILGNNKKTQGTSYTQLETFVVEYSRALQQTEIQKFDIGQLPNVNPNTTGTV